MVKSGITRFTLALLVVGLTTRISFGEESPKKEDRPRPSPPRSALAIALAP